MWPNGAPSAAASPAVKGSRHHRSHRTATRSLDGRLDLTVRAWALRDERAAAVLRRVDARRVDYLASLHASPGRTRETAVLLARLEYAAFIGAQQLFSDLPAEITRSLDRALDLLAADQPATPLEGWTGRRRAR